MQRVMSYATDIRGASTREDVPPRGAVRQTLTIEPTSGAILADIEQMIDDAANTETIDEIVIDRGTHETTSEVSVANIKENISQLLRNAKTVKPTITVRSVLPSK